MDVIIVKREDIKFYQATWFLIINVLTITKIRYEKGGFFR